jgi:ring-1,2-phenylacetyl-CoA epoxidase subunit PaaB
MSNSEQFQTWEVFWQKSRGEQHEHVGIVHAPTPEMALLFAKEQYGRRQKVVNMWVVPSSQVWSTNYEDDDMFQPAVDKSYREAFGYKIRDLINQYKAENDIAVAVKGRRETAETAETSDEGEPKKGKFKFKK